MRLSINLRGDLATLSDAELADRLAKTSQAFDTAMREPRSHGVTLRWSVRGPLRHPWFYPFTSFLAGWGPGFALFQSALGPFLSTRFGAKRAPMTDLLDQHLLLCELRDLNDVLERRVARRQASRVN